MRNLFAIIAVVLMCSFAYAQSNTANVTQDGDSNDGFVTQTGSTNTGEITQNATTGSNGNFADIDQDGDNHEGYIQQIGDNDAEISQSGGNGNFADIKQNGNFDRTYNTYGQVQRNYYGIVNQVGSDNDAWIVQAGGSGNVLIEQTGNENYAIHDQGTASYGKTYNYGKIIQNGDYNTAYQWRQATGGNNRMTIRQLNGNSNTATQDLNDVNGSDGYSHGNDLDIVQQNGDGNVATQQVFSLTLWGVGGNDLSIIQTGSDNTASQIANTSNNTSSIIQTGNMNNAEVLQQ